MAIVSPVPSVEGTDAHYVHNQIAASATWTVNHGLGKKPAVMVVDSADTVVVGEVVYLSVNVLEIRFSAPFSGKAYLN